MFAQYGAKNIRRPPTAPCIGASRCGDGDGPGPGGPGLAAHVPSNTLLLLLKGRLGLLALAFPISVRTPLGRPSVRARRRRRSSHCLGRSFRHVSLPRGGRFTRLLTLFAFGNGDKVVRQDLLLGHLIRYHFHIT